MGISGWTHTFIYVTPNKYAQCMQKKLAILKKYIITLLGIVGQEIL
jgi:hypothetical protein